MKFFLQWLNYSVCNATALRREKVLVGIRVKKKKTFLLMRETEIYFIFSSKHIMCDLFVSIVTTTFTSKTLCF